MYKITDYTKKKAAKLGVFVKHSTNKTKKNRCIQYKNR